MNALVTVDIATLTPATVFAPGGVEAIVSKIEAEVSAEIFTLETEEGRERIKSVAYKVARSKTALDEMGKELVAGIKAQSAAIDAERRTIRDRLDALKESVRGPLTAWEDAEAARVAAHEEAICFIIASPRMFPIVPGEALSAAMIRASMNAIEKLAGRPWQEFSERAEAALAEAAATLETMLATAEQNERDQAELAELRRMKAEREAADAARLIEEARIAREADAARIAEQQAAERRAYEERRERERAEKADREKIEAAARAVEQERERAARVKADEERAAAKLAANKKHRAKIHLEILADLHSHNGTCAEIVEAIATGKIRHVSVNY